MARPRVESPESSGTGLCGIIGWSICIVLLAAVLYPVVFNDRRLGGPKTNCESYMKQIGSAFRMYLSDWHDVYPTNRVVHRDGTIGPVSFDVDLTPPNKLIGTRGRNITWVEGLYGYMEPPSEDKRGNIDCGVWQCRSASTDCYPRDSKTAYTTYAMNRNLVERPATCVRQSDCTLLAREMDRMCNSELRPTNYSCGRRDVPPESPFLTDRDARIGKTNGRLHMGKYYGGGGGSNVLFADSHVRYCPMIHLDAMRWDANKKQWLVPLKPKDAYGPSVLAITP